MIFLDKQFGTQTTYLANSWNVLPDCVQERYENGIEGITRSLLTSIPEELVNLLSVQGKDHRPAHFVPNTLMALLYMKVNHISEEFFLDHIHSDAAMQYALNTETELRQPFSDNTFYRLRERLRGIYAESGRDLLQEITDMINFAIEQEVIGNLPYNDLLDRVYRIDSLNISMHGRHMSRLELVYVINRMNVNNIVSLKGSKVIPDDLQHYLDKQDHNRVIYFKGTLSELEAAASKKGISIEEVEAEVEALTASDNTKENETANPDAPDTPETSDTPNTPENAAQPANTDSAEKTESEEPKSKKSGEFNRKKRCMLIARLRLADVVDEALVIRKLMREFEINDTKEGQLLDRVIREQTKEDDKGNVIPRENSEIEGSSLQNPYDDIDDGPTCRTKDGKTTQGWSANVVQRCGSGDYAVIVDRDLEPNIHSDQAFARTFYNKFGIEGFNPETGKWSGVCCDGLYCNSYELKDLAASKGFKIFCGTLTGIAPDPILAGFDVDMKNGTVKSCPAGECPKKVTMHPEKEEFRIRMPAGTCSECEHCGKCGATVLKNNQGSVLLKLKQYNEANTMQDLGDPTYREMVNKRNAVEGVPSVLRRTYHIDQTTFFGKWYARYDLMLSTTAMNMRVLLRYRREKRKSEKEGKAAA